MPGTDDGSTGGNPVCVVADRAGWSGSVAVIAPAGGATSEAVNCVPGVMTAGADVGTGAVDGGVDGTAAVVIGAPAVAGLAFVGLAYGRAMLAAGV